MSLTTMKTQTIRGSVASNPSEEVFKTPPKNQPTQIKKDVAYTDPEKEKMMNTMKTEFLVGWTLFALLTFITIIVSFIAIVRIAVTSKLQDKGMWIVFIVLLGIMFPNPIGLVMASVAIARTKSY